MASNITLPLLLSLVLLQDMVAQEKQKLTLETDDNEVKAIEYNNEGVLIACATKDKILIWYSGSDVINKEIETNHLEINSIKFHPKSDIIISAGRDNFFGKVNSISVWDVNSGELVKSIGHHEKEILSLAFNSNGRTIASGSQDKTLKVWDFETGKEYKAIQSEGLVLSVTIDKQDKYLAYGGSDNSVTLIDLYTYEEIYKLQHKAWVRDIVFSRDGNILASAGNDRKIYITDLNNNYDTDILEKHKGWIYGLDFSADGKYIASSSEKKELFIWQIENRSHFRDFPVKGEGTIVDVAFDPNGKNLASASHYESKIDLWDVSSLNISPVYYFKDETDKTPPQIYVSSPNIQEDRVRYSKDIIEIKGAVIDESGVRRMRINGIDTPIRDNGNFLINLPLTAGDNFVTMEVTDVNDNIALKKFVVQRRDLDGGEYDAGEATNYLFIVGINDYLYWPKLSNAVNDVNDVAGMLMGMYNFEFGDVTLIRDEQATRNNIYKGLRSLIEKVTPKDNLLIYFSGHGFYDELLNEGYWIPVDAKLHNSGDYLSNSDILKIIGNVDSQHTFLVADACFAGSLFNDQKRGYADNVEQFRSRWGLASGRLEVVSDGTEGKNSPFASNFIKFLKENTKDKIAVSELVQYVKMQVAEESNQTPIGNPLKGAGDEGGEFIFYKKK